jgi:citrate lyase subunit beta/citryl-CoA lyase
MFQKKLPNWRSLLFCPANMPRFIAKAHSRGADAIILDLEDSVPETEKASAREGLIEAASTVGQAGADICVRINRPLEQAVEDIAAAVGHRGHPWYSSWAYQVCGLSRNSGSHSETCINRQG